MTARTGQLGKDNRDKTTVDNCRKAAMQDSWDRMSGTEQTEQVPLDRLPGQDREKQHRKNTVARTGQPGEEKLWQGNQDKKAGLAQSCQL
jgi:hypothetical protein